VSYRVEIDPSARKELDQLPGYVRAQGLQVFHLLKDNPRPPRAKSYATGRVFTVSGSPGAGESSTKSTTPSKSSVSCASGARKTSTTTPLYHPNEPRMPPSMIELAIYVVISK
jgi:hypothetical protein